jgi:hypothetical protein
MGQTICEPAASDGTHNFFDNAPDPWRSSSPRWGGPWSPSESICVLPWTEASRNASTRHKRMRKGRISNLSRETSMTQVKLVFQAQFGPSN